MKTRWLGYVTFAQEYSGMDPGFYGKTPPREMRLDDEVEIGLREDGVVIWRKKEKPEPEPKKQP